MKRIGAWRKIKRKKDVFDNSCTKLMKTSQMRRVEKALKNVKTLNSNGIGAQACPETAAA